jgi:lipoyl(octanoyl) transferase
VDCSLEGFVDIVPCGIADRPVGRLADWRPDLTAIAVAPRLLDHFSQRFGLCLRQPLPDERLA